MITREQFDEQLEGIKARLRERRWCAGPEEEKALEEAWTLVGFVESLVQQIDRRDAKVSRWHALVSKCLEERKEEKHAV